MSITLTKLKNLVKEAGTYKKSDDIVIQAFHDVIVEYEMTKNQLKRIQEQELKEGVEIETITLENLERLRKEILNFTDKLGLNPKSRKAITDISISTGPALETRVSVPNVPSFRVNDD